MASVNVMLVTIAFEAFVLACLLLLLFVACLRKCRRRVRVIEEEWRQSIPQALRGRRAPIERLRKTLRSSENLCLFQDFVDAHFRSTPKPPALELRALCRALGFTDWLTDTLSRSRDELKRAAAAKTLGHLREQIDAQPLEELLRSDDPAVVLSAGYATASTRQPQMFLPVLRSIYKRTPITLHGAAELLSRFGPGLCPVAHGLLEDLIGHYESGQVADIDENTSVAPSDIAAQVIIVDLLAFFRFLPSADVLADLLVRTEHEEVLIHIVKAIARLGRRRHVPRLEPLLRHSNWVVRSQTSLALATLNAKESLPLIAQLADDADPRVRAAANRAYLSLEELPTKVALAV